MQNCFFFFFLTLSKVNDRVPNFPRSIFRRHVYHDIVTRASNDRFNNRLCAEYFAYARSSHLIYTLSLRRNTGKFRGQITELLVCVRHGEGEFHGKGQGERVALRERGYTRRGESSTRRCKENFPVKRNKGCVCVFVCVWNVEEAARFATTHKSSRNRTIRRVT